ncbi:MAG: hypothetical protein U1F71_09605 [Verrucomicrobiaceae bacterium]
MRLDKQGTIAWGTAAIVFAVAFIVILFAPKAYVARARVEISALDVAPTGLASFVRVDFAFGNRTLPQEMVSRMNSTGSVRRALRKLGLPDDEKTTEATTDALMTHLVPGSTTIEVMARAESATKAAALVEAIIAAQDEMRREERVSLADQVTKVLDAAAAELASERTVLAQKLTALDVHRPVDYSTYSVKIGETLVGVTTQRLKLAESLRRLESLESKGTADVIQNMDDLSTKKVEEDSFASNVGYVALRSALTARQAELARIQTVQGTNTDVFKKTVSEIQSLEASLRQYLQGAIVQLRSQIDALDKSAAEIEKRLKEREEAIKSVLNAQLSPEYEALSLRSEAIRAQLAQIEHRRAEIQTYRQLYQPALTITVPVEAEAAPEDRYRGARLVFAAFGALLAGLSLSTILHHRAVRTLELAQA